MVPHLYEIIMIRGTCPPSFLAFKGDQFAVGGGGQGNDWHLLLVLYSVLTHAGSSGSSLRFSLLVSFFAFLFRCIIQVFFLIII